MDYSVKINRIDIEETGARLSQDAGAAVRQAEHAYHEKVDAVCRACVARGVEVLLLCGPSAAGKTTSSKRLEAQLRAHGRQTARISLDNFYRTDGNMPRWEDGATDYESIEGLELSAFDDGVRRLFAEGQATFPVFDFKNPKACKTFTLAHKPGDVLIVEGLHALNPRIGALFAGMETLRVYVSTHSDYRSGEETVLPARYLRLCRRLLRDHRHRNADANVTFEMWKYITRGEETYIHPFRHTADYKIDTAHDYEPFLYCARLAAQLEETRVDPAFGEYKERLTAALSRFSPIPESLIPASSLIQEFIRKAQ